MAQRQRVISYDVLRIIAAFSIVWLHISSLYWQELFPSLEWEIKTVFLSLVRWSVPVFVMISGALFLDVNKPCDIRRLFTKNILRLVCAFLFWSFLSQVLDSGLGIGLTSLFINTINGPSYLWFLKMMLGLYVMIPVLKMIVSDRRTEVYYLVLSVIVVFVIPPVFDMVSLYSEPFTRFLKGNYEITEISEILDFSSYFVLGHYLATRSFCRRVRYMVYALAVGCVVFTVFGVHYYSHAHQQANAYLYDYTNILTLVESAAVFLFVKDSFASLSSSARGKVITVSNCCFGIYLVHPFVMRMLDGLFAFPPTSFMHVLTIPLTAFMVFIVSFLIVRVICLIPYLNKYIV